jgi:hypothetical protein
VETTKRVEEWWWWSVGVVFVEERKREWIGFVVSIRGATERSIGVGEKGGERRFVVIVEKRGVRFVHGARVTRE